MSDETDLLAATNAWRAAVVSTTALHQIETRGLLETDRLPAGHGFAGRPSTYGQYFARFVTPPALSASTTMVVVGVSIRRSPN